MMNINSRLNTILVILVMASVLPSFLGLGAEDEPVLNRIVFVSHRDGNSEIYIMDSDGKNQRNLSNHGARDWQPHCSPDGTKAIFESDRDENWEIYVVDIDDQTPINLTNNEFDDKRPAWSPDGNSIAFHSNRDDNWEIYIMNVDGTTTTRLTDYKFQDWNATWSPDGEQIAFERGQKGLADTNEICLINTDGTDLKQLTTNNVYDGNLRWSPNGKQIAFISKRNGNAEIYLMNADGTTPTRLTYLETEEWNPVWSPDGTKIAFESRVLDGAIEIWVMAAIGGNPTRLTDPKVLNQSPTWSWDGKRILFGSMQDGNSEIYEMDIDGTKQHRLTENKYADINPSVLPPQLSFSEAFSIALSEVLTPNSQETVFVIDKSMSMDGLLKTARDELIGFLDKCPVDDQVNVIFHNNNVFPWKKEGLWSLKDYRTELYLWINEHQTTTGRTNTFDALMSALEMYGCTQTDTNKTPLDPQSIVLISDGNPSEGQITYPEKILQEIYRVNNGQVMIHTIYIGPGGGGTRFMQALAEQNRGKHIEIRLRRTRSSLRVQLVRPQSLTAVVHIYNNMPYESEYTLTTNAIGGGGFHSAVGFITLNPYQKHTEIVTGMHFRLTCTANNKTWEIWSGLISGTEYSFDVKYPKNPTVPKK